MSLHRMPDPEKNRQQIKRARQARNTKNAMFVALCLGVFGLSYYEITKPKTWKMPAGSESPASEERPKKEQRVEQVQAPSAAPEPKPETPQERIEKAKVAIQKKEPAASDVCEARAFLRSLPRDVTVSKDYRSVEAKIAAVERSIVAQERAAALSEQRGIICADGSVSPSCVCGRIKRGCCSRHGGVRGCEEPRKVEDKISCPN